MECAPKHASTANFIKSCHRERAGMVLEHLFPEDWLEKKWFYAFILGVVYSVFGIIFAKILFPGDPALVSVAFISLLMLPELYKLFSIEERVEDREQRFTFGKLIRDNRGFVKTYLFLFLGILLVYSTATIFLPSFEANTLFREQLEMRDVGGDAIASGMATGIAFDTGLFWAIFKNNLIVLMFCFLISFLTGDGAIFLVTWNASVWGTVFGITAKNAAIFTGANPLVYFGIIMLIVLPHVILESSSYFIAAISGGVISKDVLLERVDSVRFKRVFIFNFWLFIIAIAVLVAGGLTETYVLGNMDIYSDIIVKSLQGG